jgi:hypothetical protein
MKKPSKPVLEFQVLATSKPTDSRRWAAVRITCANGDTITVEATARKRHVTHREKKAKVKK